MSHPSSSVGQTPARQGQLSKLDPGAQTCILVYFFWGYDPQWSIEKQSRFATCVKDYIGERFHFWLQPQDILRYYNSIPAAVKQAGHSHAWNEDMLGLCIAELIQDSREFDKMTDLSLGLAKELSEEALHFIGQAGFKMYYDGRKDKVQAVWAARVSQIEEETKKIPKRPSRDTDTELQPKYLESDSFSGSLIDILSMSADMYLRSSANGKD